MDQEQEECRNGDRDRDRDRRPGYQAQDQAIQNLNSVMESKTQCQGHGQGQAT